MSQQRKLRFLKIPPPQVKPSGSLPISHMGRGKLSSPESGFADEPHVGEVRAPARPCSGAQLAAL